MPDTREFLVVLRISTDDPSDDLRRYPFEDVLAPPEGEPPRFVKVVSAVEVKRA